MGKKRNTKKKNKQKKKEKKKACGVEKATILFPHLLEYYLIIVYL
jgi:hypothetical protein